MTKYKRIISRNTILYLTLLFGLTASVALAAEQSTATNYRIGPEDVLEVSVWKEEGLQKEVLVRPDGGFSFPLLGDVQAASKTISQLIGDMKVRLTKYINDPVVSVSVTKVGGKNIYVMGKVNKPGKYSVQRYVDVMQALSVAGGMTSFAETDEIKILRRAGSELVAIPFDYSVVSKGLSLEQSIILENGDIIVVP